MIHKITRHTVPLKNNKPKSTTVILLASSPNEGMRTMPSVSLINVDGQHNVLDIQYEAINIAYPSSDIILVSGHDSHAVMNKKPKQIRMVDNQLFESAGDVEELRIGLNCSIGDSALIADGKCIFDAKAISQLQGHGSCTLIDVKKQISEDSIGVIFNNTKVESFAFDMPHKWCYITYLEGRELEILKKFVAIKSKSNLCLFEAMNHVINRGGLVRPVMQSHGFVRRISSRKDL